jgi:hypothetical protein
MVQGMTHNAAAMGPRIRARLAEMDRDASWLARMLETDLSVVSRWLNGRRPIPPYRHLEIARVLHRPVAWLTAPDPEPTGKAA